MPRNRNRSKVLSAQLNKKKGLYPGAPVYVGPERPQTSTWDWISYTDQTCDVETGLSLESPFKKPDPKAVNWLNWIGLQDVQNLTRMAQTYAIHPLILEDVVNTLHRPKLQDIEGHIFVVFKGVRIKDGQLESEHISVVINTELLISFQEQRSDIFEALRNRIKNKMGKVRQKKNDYLLAILMDAAVDQYFDVIHFFQALIDELEDKPIGPERSTGLVRVREQLLEFRRYVLPILDVFQTIKRGDLKEIQIGTLKYFSDVQDNAIQVADATENLLEQLRSIDQHQMAVVNLRLSQSMTFLTRVATVFIPLTFIVGVYGMNFQNMPELQWQWGYVLVWVVMILTALVITLWLVHLSKHDK